MPRVILQTLALLLAITALASAGGDSPDPKPARPRAETMRVKWTTKTATRRQTYHVPRMRENLVIDADWNKPAWKDVEPLVLEYYMGEEPAHQPKTQAKVAYDKDNLYLIWRVDDNFVRAVCTKHQGRVWLDSCVEFFFTPRGKKDAGYFNFETSCTGKMLFAAHAPDGAERRIAPKDLGRIEIASSLDGPIDPEITKPTVWTLEYRVPVNIVAKYAKVQRPGPGVTWRANFYKCADESSHPHWLTWSPVASKKPQFHLPKYFGTLVFE